MKILWLSKHSPLPSQLAELRRLFGPSVVMHPDPRPFSDAHDIARRFRESGAQELVAVAPLSVIKALCELGIQPLWAEMERCDSAGAEVKTGRNGHGVSRGTFSYKFVRFRRVTGVDLKFEEVETCRE